jgi:DNA-binding transcriptional regulator GbsR (MarR family)
MKKAKDIEQTFIDRTGKIAKNWGLGEPTGRIIGAMYFSEEPLSQREIAEKTGYTLSLVSPCLKIIEEHNIARKIRGNGKEKIYETTASFIEVFDKMIKRFLQHDILPLIEELDSAKEQNPGKKKIIEQMSRDYKKVERYMSLFEKICYLHNFKDKKMKKILARC